MAVDIDAVYGELKRLHSEVTKTNSLLLGLVPIEKTSAKELARLKRIKAEMDSGAETRYSRNLF